LSGCPPTRDTSDKASISSPFFPLSHFRPSFPSFSRTLPLQTRRAYAMPSYFVSCPCCNAHARSLQQRSSSSRRRPIRPCRGSASCLPLAKSLHADRGQMVRSASARPLRRRMSRCAWVVVRAQTSSLSIWLRMGGSPLRYPGIALCPQLRSSPTWWQWGFNHSTAFAFHLLLNQEPVGGPGLRCAHVP